jgi:hypothetical protein
MWVRIRGTTFEHLSGASIIQPPQHVHVLEFTNSL